tara:strand:+ start:264 stop:446 length:183 start_codon:yes stop_codon:yes gene_type:complete
MKLTESRIKEIIKEEMSKVNELEIDTPQLEENYEEAMKKITDEDIKAHIIAYISSLGENQ